MKEGIKSTEFWLTLLTNVTALVGSLQGVIPPEVGAIVVAVANGVYGILRSIVKAKTPEAPKA